MVSSLSSDDKVLESNSSPCTVEPPWTWTPPSEEDILDYIEQMRANQKSNDTREAITAFGMANESSGQPDPRMMHDDGRRML